ncbi:hypothetical protein AAF712_012807 [Marasmius tenuissimus]|uniref:CCHC-type domain-containing protein n=1 Tax=Marasmius tenuissimus TaxID=585030 RepID=A0ABR2ZI83_9AGAR
MPPPFTSSRKLEREAESGQPRTRVTVEPTLRTARANRLSGSSFDEVYAVALPAPHSRDAPRTFKGSYSQVESWIRQYERLLAKHEVIDSREQCEGLLDYCSIKVNRTIRTLKSYRTGSWRQLKKDILRMYDAERALQRYQPSDLQALALKQASRPIENKSQWLRYVRRFQEKGGELVSSGKMTDRQYATYFWLGIPLFLQQILESQLRARKPNRDISEPYPVDEVSEVAESYFHRSHFKTMVPDAGMFGVLKNEDSGEDSDNEEDTDSELDDLEVWKKTKAHRKLEKKLLERMTASKKETSPHKAVPSAEVARTTTFQGPQEEVADLISRLNSMQLENPEYGVLYYRAVKMDPESKECIRRSPPSVVQTSITHPNIAPISADNRPYVPITRDGRAVQLYPFEGRPPSSSRVTCFGCGIVGHRIGDCPEVAGKLRSAEIKRDPVSRQFVLPDDTLIPRGNPGETFLQVLDRMQRDRSRQLSSSQPSRKSMLVTVPQLVQNYLARQSREKNHESWNDRATGAENSDDGDSESSASESISETDSGDLEYRDDESDDEWEEFVEEIPNVGPQVLGVERTKAAAKEVRQKWQSGPRESTHDIRSRRIVKSPTNADGTRRNWRETLQPKNKLNSVGKQSTRKFLADTQELARPEPVVGPSNDGNALPANRESSSADRNISSEIERVRTVTPKPGVVPVNPKPYDARPMNFRRAVSLAARAAWTTPYTGRNASTAPASKVKRERKSELARRISRQQILDKILGTTVQLPLGDFLGASRELSAVLHDLTKVNVISSNVYEDVIQVPVDVSRHTVMNDANGGEGVLRGAILGLKLNCGQVETSGFFYVGDKVPFFMLLGRPWMRENRISIDERKNGTYLVFKDRQTWKPRYEMMVAIAPGDTLPARTVKNRTATMHAYLATCEDPEITSTIPETDSEEDELDTEVHQVSSLSNNGIDNTSELTSESDDQVDEEYGSNTMTSVAEKLLYPEERNRGGDLVDDIEEATSSIRHSYEREDNPDIDSDPEEGSEDEFHSSGEQVRHIGFVPLADVVNSRRPPIPNQQHNMLRRHSEPRIRQGRRPEDVLADFSGVENGVRLILHIWLQICLVVSATILFWVCDKAEQICQPPQEDKSGNSDEQETTHNNLFLYRMSPTTRSQSKRSDEENGHRTKKSTSKSRARNKSKALVVAPVVQPPTPIHPPDPVQAPITSTPPSLPESGVLTDPRPVDLVPGLAPNSSYELMQALCNHSTSTFRDTGRVHIRPVVVASTQGYLLSTSTTTDGDKRLSLVLLNTNLMVNNPLLRQASLQVGHARVEFFPWPTPLPTTPQGAFQQRLTYTYHARDAIEPGEAQAELDRPARRMEYNVETLQGQVDDKNKREGGSSTSKWINAFHDGSHRSATPTVWAQIKPAGEDTEMSSSDSGSEESSYPSSDMDVDPSEEEVDELVASSQPTSPEPPTAVVTSEDSEVVTVTVPPGPITVSIPSGTEKVSDILSIPSAKMTDIFPVPDFQDAVETASLLESPPKAPSIEPREPSRSPSPLGELTYPEERPVPDVPESPGSAETSSSQPEPPSPPTPPSTEASSSESEKATTKLPIGPVKITLPPCSDLLPEPRPSPAARRTILHDGQVYTEATCTVGQLYACTTRTPVGKPVWKLGEAPKIPPFLRTSIFNMDYGHTCIIRELRVVYGRRVLKGLQSAFVEMHHHGMKERTEGMVANGRGPNLESRLRLAQKFENPLYCQEQEDHFRFRLAVDRNEPATMPIRSIGGNFDRDRWRQDHEYLTVSVTDAGRWVFYRKELEYITVEVYRAMVFLSEYFVLLEADHVFCARYHAYMRETSALIRNPSYLVNAILTYEYRVWLIAAREILIFHRETDIAAMIDNILKIKYLDSAGLEHLHSRFYIPRLPDSLPGTCPTTWAAITNRWETMSEFKQNLTYHPLNGLEIHPLLRAHQPTSALLKAAKLNAPYKSSPLSSSTESVATNTTTASAVVAL